MDNHSRGDNPSSQHKNESIRYLSRISTCFQKEGVGIFCDNNNFSFCSLSKHNYAPVEIPLFKVPKPIQKAYTLDEVALIIGRLTQIETPYLARRGPRLRSIELHKRLLQTPINLCHATACKSKSRESNIFIEKK